MLSLEQEQDKKKEFICPCGKSYFSYAALFTHVKQKHQGKAPGQIIKPQSENKRGRPRKTPSQPHCYSTNQSPFMSKTPSKSQDLLLSHSPKSNQDFKQTTFSFKPTAGSTFKHYQSEESIVPTIKEQASPSSFQSELFQDLSKSFEFEFLNSVPEILLKKQKTYVMLCEESQNGDIVGCVRNFLKFCEVGVRKQTHSQLVLLMSMLLQHIIDSQKERKMKELSTNQIHKHIISFFDYVTQQSKDIDLTLYDIFKSVSTIKSLIIFFNWLNRFQAQQHEKRLKQQPRHEYSIKAIISILFEAAMDIVFSNRISANIFKECAKAIIEQRQYHQTPIQMRKKIEDCLDIYIDHHTVVMSGMERVKLQPFTPPKA